MIVARLVAAFAFAGLACAGPACAQTVTTRSETATSGKVKRLVVSPGLKKDCSIGSLPEIKIVTAPKNGQLQTRSGKLKTPASYRCPGKDTQVSGVFYRSNSGFTGSDQALIDVKTADGVVERQDIRITVEAAKPGDDKTSGGGKDAAKDANKDEKKSDKDLSDL